MFAESGVQEAVSSSIFLGIAEGQFIACRVFLQQAKGMAEANLIVCARQQTWAIEVGAQPNKQIGAGAARCRGLPLGEG